MVGAALSPPFADTSVSPDEARSLGGCVASLAWVLCLCHSTSDPFGPADQSNARRQRGIGRRLGDAFSLFLMLLGSITFALMLGIGGYWAWTARLRDLWAQWIGAPPF